MPILTNSEGMKTVEFGAGDILLHHVCTGTNSSNGLSFKQHEPRVIGERTEEYAGLEMEEHNPEVHFTFKSIDSVDVLIEMLHEVRDCMVAEEVNSQ
ncbi:hypothetical protein [Paenibacillus sp. FSL L8-0708]|uniref:hypothetical protein n=1 Tax=Paenibacillus sp. FSL L8-0708 TaxID=2975311 RepID=UPI0030FCDA5A